MKSDSIGNVIGDLVQNTIDNGSFNGTCRKITTEAAHSIAVRTVRAVITVKNDNDDGTTNINVSTEGSVYDDLRHLLDVVQYVEEEFTNIGFIKQFKYKESFILDVCTQHNLFCKKLAEVDNTVEYAIYKFQAMELLDARLMNDIFDDYESAHAVATTAFKEMVINGRRLAMINDRILTHARMLGYKPKVTKKRELFVVEGQPAFTTEDK